MAMRVREEVEWFAAEHMERRLAVQDAYRTSWKHSSVSNRYLMNNLLKNAKSMGDLVDDLRKIANGALAGNFEPSDVMLYALELLDTCADVANYAMMIADKTRGALLDTLEIEVEFAGKEEGHSCL